MDAQALDEVIEDLQAAKARWAHLPVADKVAMLEGVVTRTDAVAATWVEAATKAKGIPDDSPLVGEEWITGPWSLIAAATGLAETLRAVAAGRDPLAKVRRRTRPDGRVVLDVFPANLWDRLLLSGYEAEVWMQPGVTEADLAQHVACFYREVDPPGRVDLVLGAGNINSIPPLDVLTKLYGEGAVAVVKLNPVNDYLFDVLEQVFAPHIEQGFVRFVHGGADIGAYLCEHPGIEAVHITGSARTHDAIVFGVGDEGARRKAANEPRLAKPITSELGGVGATIVVPGPWSDADIAYQAENLATMKLHNAGCNCIAMQVLVLPAQWDRSDALVDALAATIRGLEPRVPYYPGAAERRAALVAEHPDAEDLDSGEVPRTLIRDVDPAHTGDACFTVEVFGTTLATTKLPGDGAAAYLRAAVRFCNEVLDGTLGVQLLVHPRTMKELGPQLDAAVADLRYGTVGVNVWNALGYQVMRTPWGAYPGHTLDAVGSGIGTVHNTYLLDGSEKVVVRGPFRTLPRSLRHGEMHLAPKPPWFVTHARAATVGEQLTHFAAQPSWGRLLRMLPDALRG